MNRFKFTKLTSVVFLLSLLMSGAAPTIRAESTNPEVKRLLQEGLKLYSERQYVRALDLFKQVQRLDPTNERAEEYIKNSKQRIMEWELQGGEAQGEEVVTWDSIMGGDGSKNNAKDIIEARKSLVERMRNRSTNTDNIVKINETKKGLEVTLFHDHLFLPGLQTLRDESLPILANVASIIRTGGDRDVTINSVSTKDSNDPYRLYPEFALPAADPTLPQMGSTDTAFIFQNIEATRSMILFTYLAQKSLGQEKSIINE